MIGLLLAAAAAGPIPTVSRIPVGYDFVCDAIGTGRQTKTMRGQIDASYDAASRQYQTRLTISTGPNTPALSSIEAYAVGSSVTASEWSGANERYLIAVHVPTDETVRNGNLLISREVAGDPTTSSTVVVGICNMAKRGDF